MKTCRIALLMTCHNRRGKTLASLDSFFDQVSREKIDAQVYLVDAGSTDGTDEAVRRQFPEVNVILRDNSVFWSGGMRVAFQEAIKYPYDYYLWLNDDTKLLPEAIKTLLQTVREIKKKERRDCIIVGSTQDPKSRLRTYGGMVRPNRWRPFLFHAVQPSDQPQPCDTMNGNCVLIPRSIALSVGNISPEFTHAIGDIDYGLRARSLGFSIWCVPGFVGLCARNRRPPWTDPNLPLMERLKILHTPKGLPPREWVAFVRRHAGVRWPLYWLKLHMRVLVPKLWKRLGKQNMGEMEEDEG